MTGQLLRYAGSGRRTAAGAGGPRLVIVAKCPSARELLAFAEGTKTPAGIAAHIEACGECAGLVADIAAFPDIELREGAAPATEEESAVDRDAIRLKTADAHLTPRLLVAFCDGSLCGVSEELVMDHLATCQTCADAMLELTDRPNPEASWATFVARHGDELGFGEEGEGDK